MIASARAFWKFVSSSYLFYPLYKLINLSIANSVFPSSWKIADVIPIHKSGPCDNPNNYRPVQILPVLSKIIERHVAKSCNKAQVKLRNYEGYEDGFSIHANKPRAHLKTSYKRKNLPWQLKPGKIKQKYLKADQWYTKAEWPTRRRLTQELSSH